MGDIEKRIFCNNVNDLKIDEACFHVVSSGSENLSLFRIVEECYMCDFQPWVTIPPFTNVSLIVDTEYPLRFHFKSESQLWCTTTYRFQEYGEYRWNINEKTGCSSVEIISEPPVPFLSLISALLVLLGFILLWNIGMCIYKSEKIARLRERFRPFSELESDLGSPSSPEAPTMSRSDILPAVLRQKPRVAAVDVFRGMCVTLMIFVNYGGGSYWFFKHSAWNGLTFSDLVLPGFLWVMGVSLVISMRGLLRSAVPRRQVLAKVVRRSAILIVLGIMLNIMKQRSPTDLAAVRLPGVLQRIGLSYCIVGTMEAFLMQPQGSGQWPMFQDVLDAWVQWLMILAMVGTHVVLTFLLPVPGCPLGYLGPGGLDWSLTRGDKYMNCTGGAAGYVDRLIFGSGHIYQHGTFQKIYQTDLQHDPEGLLGIFSSVLLLYWGVQAGRILVSYHYTVSRIVRWGVWSLISGVLGAVLCNFSKEEGWIPVNKNLFSLSYVLVTGCFGFLLMIVLYLIVDAKRWWNGGPFLHAGMNALFLYLGHEVVNNKFPWAWKSYYGTHAEFLAMNLWGTGLWLLIAFIMFKNDVFITV